MPRRRPPNTPPPGLALAVDAHRTHHQAVVEHDNGSRALDRPAPVLRPGSGDRTDRRRPRPESIEKLVPPAPSAATCCAHERRNHPVPDRNSRSDLDDLRRRLRQTRWPEAETVDDWSQGMPLGYARDAVRVLAGRATTGARARRASMRSRSSGREIDGLDIHFLHVRSPHEDALPLVLTHGWPGSIVEFRKVIGPLTDPAAHGGDPADAFHVVCPSLPGFGFSGKPARAGWGVERIADAWDELMTRLGYARYGAQGGDWGSGVTHSARHPACRTIVDRHPPQHGRPRRPIRPRWTTSPRPSRRPWPRSSTTGDWDSGYSKEQSTRPQSSRLRPGRLARRRCAPGSWRSSGPGPTATATRPTSLSQGRDARQRHAVLAARAPARRRPGCTGRASASRWPGSVQVPVGCSIFPKEIFRSSRRWAQRQLPGPAVLERAGQGRPLRRVRAAVDVRRRGPGRLPGISLRRA